MDFYSGSDDDFIDFLLKLPHVLERISNEIMYYFSNGIYFFNPARWYYENELPEIYSEKLASISPIQSKALKMIYNTLIFKKNMIPFDAEKLSRDQHQFYLGQR